MAFASQLNKKGKLATSGIDGEIKYQNKGESTTIKFPLVYQQLKNIILFEGIGYVLINERNKSDVSKRILLGLCKEYGKLAFGAILYEDNKITPYVYVRRVNSFVRETACGSGSIAFSIFSGFRKIIQPTGKSIEVNIKKDKVLVTAEVREGEMKKKKESKMMKELKKNRLKFKRSINRIDNAKFIFDRDLQLPRWILGIGIGMFLSVNLGSVLNIKEGFFYWAGIVAYILSPILLLIGIILVSCMAKNQKEAMTYLYNQKDKEEAKMKTK